MTAPMSKKDAMKWLVDGIDLRDAFDKALTLPSLRPAKGRAKWRKRSGGVWRTLARGVSGRAWPLGGEIHLSVTSSTIATREDARDAVAVLLHELAHVACAAAKEPYGDAGGAFGRRCIDAHDEWNEKFGHIIEVDRHGHGAPYRGKHGRAVREARERAAARRRQDNV